CHRRFRQHAPTTDTAPLSLHDALPIYPIEWNALKFIGPSGMFLDAEQGAQMRELLQGEIPRARWAELGEVREDPTAAERHLAKIDRKSTRLNSSHVKISYAVFCLKKKK